MPHIDNKPTEYPYNYPYDTKLEALSNKIIEYEEGSLASRVGAYEPILLKSKLEYILYTIDALNKESKMKKEVSLLLSLQTTEERINKLEKEIKTRIKDEESFRLLVGRRLCELENHLTIKDSYYTKEKLKTEEYIKIKFEYIKTKFETLIDLNDVLVKKVESHTREQIKTEERLNKLEADNRELRKIIDELRPTKSKYM